MRTSFIINLGLSLGLMILLSGGLICGCGVKKTPDNYFSHPVQFEDVTPTPAPTQTPTPEVD